MHKHANTTAVINRLSRAVGHLSSVKKMVEDCRDCSDVLIQLSAVKAEINSISKVILQEHLSHCIVEAAETGDKEMIEHLNEAIKRML